MLRIILTLFFELSYQQDSKIYCNKDEVFYLGQQLIPFSYQNGTLVENQMQNQEILQLIGRVSIQHLFDNKELVLKQFQQNELQLIFWDDDHYICKYIVMNLNFENSYLRIHEEIVVDQVTFQLPLCTKFLSMYSIKEQIFILCEQEFFIQLFVLERDKGSSELRIATTSQVDKKQNCQSQIKFEQDLYLAFLNCQDWVIYVVRNGTFEIFIQLEQLNNRVLKSFSIQQDILLQFDYEIYQITTFNEGWFYSNQSRQIQSYFRHHQQHAIFFKGENKIELSNVGFNWILFITCEETPKQVVHLEDKLIINYGDYLQVLETIDNQLILPISVDYLSNELFNYPIIYAFYQNEIMILKKNIPNPTIQCNEFKKADYVFYTYNYLFQRNAVIKSQLVTENQSLQRFYIKSFSRNMTFQFKIYKPFIFIGDYSYKKDVDNQTNFSCQQNLEQLFSCENILDSNIIWSKSKHNKELYILFQNSKKKLIIKNCNKNLETELGQYENFETHNIYEFSNVFLLIFKQQTKVLLIYCQSDYYEQMIVESKDQIINVVYENFFVHLISKTCTQYIIIGKQLFLHQLNQYILLDGECIRAELFKDFLVYVHKGSIIMIKNNITNTITIENAYILNIYRISSMQDCLIIHLKNQDEEYLSKQLLINNRLIKLYDIPKLNFKYSSPMISKIYKFVLILAAYNGSGNQVLLVYYINSNYQNLLIDIIQVDNFNFDLSNEYLMTYQFDNEIKMINIKVDQFICKISPFPEFIKIIEFPLNSLYKTDLSNYQLSTVNLTLYNIDKILQPKQQQLLLPIPHQFEMQESVFQLDPRLYIIGPIDQINATGLIITDPFQKQGQISQLQCEQIRNQVCINYRNNLLIFNPFSVQEIITPTFQISEEIKNVIKFQDLIFVLIKNEYLTTIQVYNTREQSSFQVPIPQKCIVQVQMQILLNLCILLCPQIIYFYKIHTDTLEPFSELQTQYMQCYTTEIANANQTFLYLVSETSINQFSLITIYDDVYHDYSNRTKMQVFYIPQEHPGISAIKNITQVSDNYYEMRILSQVIEGLFYYFQAFIDANDNRVILQNDIALIRYFHFHTNKNKMHFIGNDIIMLHVIDSPNSTYYIYNVSNAFNLKEIDYIHSFELDDTYSILPYDDQHIIKESKTSLEYILYKIVPYELRMKGGNQDKMIIEFKNSVSSLEIQINRKTPKNYYVQGIVIFFAILICFLLKCLKRNKHVHSKKSKETEL